MKKTLLATACVFLVVDSGLWFCSSQKASAAAVVLYAAPAGSGGACTLAAPCGLQAALSTAYSPGSSIQLRAGVYRGRFASPGAGPVTITAYPGEAAQLVHDGSAGNLLTITGSAQTWTGLDFSGRAPAVNPPNALLSITGDGHRIIGNAIHDGNIGIFAGEGATNLAVDGNLIFYNGVQSSLEHGLYLQNGDVGTKTITNNLIFHNGGFGLHAYGSAGKVRNMVVRGNASIQNGTILGTRSRSFFFQSGVTMNGLDIENNLTYDVAGGTSTIQLQVDGPAGSSGAIVKGNTLVGPEPLLINRFAGLTVTGNTIIPRTGWDAFVDVNGSSGTFNANAYSLGYAPDHDPQRWRWNGALQTFSAWKTASGFDATSTYAEPAAGHPAANATFVAGRFVVVYNWTRAATVLVDLSPILTSGDTFEVRYYQSPMGSPVLAGTYTGGSVSLQTAGLTVTAPVTFPGSVTPPLTAPEFLTFVVTKKGAPSWTPTPSPSSVPSSTATPSTTPTATSTASPSPSSTPTSTPTPTRTPTATPTSTPTSTSTATPMPTNTPTMTDHQRIDDHEIRIQRLERTPS